MAQRPDKQHHVQRAGWKAAGGKATAWARQWLSEQALQPLTAPMRHLCLVPPFCCMLY